ncbi:hypothetical protein OG350_05460 [Streptomyces achromogenes]|uniref:Uncharacterized protein n=1 Tax=Streptomyces achromogenes TaxID=67255 RepID=A0ABZ1KJ15_STRAH
MEREENAVESVNPRDAREALDRAAGARERSARAAVHPGWYYPAMGCCLLIAFASVSADLMVWGVPFGIGIGPALIALIASGASGATPDRSYATPATRRISYLFALLVVVLAAIGLVLEWVADMRWSAAACGLLALALTVTLGRRLDRTRADELGGGEVRP